MPQCLDRNRNSSPFLCIINWYNPRKLLFPGRCLVDSSDVDRSSTKHSIFVSFVVKPCAHKPKCISIVPPPAPPVVSRKVLAGHAEVEAKTSYRYDAAFSSCPQKTPDGFLRGATWGCRHLTHEVASQHWLVSWVVTVPFPWGRCCSRQACSHL